MQILHGIPGLKSLPQGAVASIGNFDGLHLGHKRIIEMCKNFATRTRAVAIITFEPHPLTVLRPELAPPRLTPASLKEELLAAMGVDYLIVLPPEPQVLNLSAEEFWRILHTDAKISHLVEGANFTFGKGRGGNIQRLQEWSKGSDLTLHIVDPVEAVLLDLSIVPVSSSLIRWLLANGRVRDAAICLGRPYILEGEVIKGHQRGRELGVPTANLQCGPQLIPPDAVYAGRCTIDTATYAAAVSIGTMPTFGENQRQIEAHLLGFNGDLYGQTIRVELMDWLRDQRKYNTIDALKVQIAHDLEQVEERVGMSLQHPLAVYDELLEVLP